MQPPARHGCDPNSISVSALFPDPFNLNMCCNAACLHSEYISYVDVINGIDLSTQVSHLTPPIVSWWFLACIQTQQTSQQLFHFEFALMVIIEVLLALTECVMIVFLLYLNSIHLFTSLRTGSNNKTVHRFFQIVAFGIVMAFWSWMALPVIIKIFGWNTWFDFNCNENS